MLLLQVNEGDVTVCGSRISMNVEANAGDRLCHDTDGLQWNHLCGRYLDQCDPIYLAVTGSSSRTSVNCQGERCRLSGSYSGSCKGGSGCSGSSSSSDSNGEGDVVD